MKSSPNIKFAQLPCWLDNMEVVQAKTRTLRYLFVKFPNEKDNNKAKTI